MLSFEVHELQIAGRYYILLPKLNSTQMGTFATRLLKEGFSIQGSHLLRAKSGKRTIYIEPSGICWSSFDPADVVLPVVPEVLACPKEKASVAELESMYFQIVKSGKPAVVRLFPRVESSSNWDRLRAAGDCGLAPDERLVTSYLISEADGTSMLTDFPVDGSTSRTYGRRRYFESNLDRALACATLRTTGGRAPRNTYLPRDGTLRIRALSISRRKVVDLSGELGEWCSFTPA